MTVYWCTPSHRILALVTISCALVISGCLACGFLLYFSPEEPNRIFNGGYYASIPSLCLVIVAAITIFTLILGWLGICRESKVVLIVFSVVTIILAIVQIGSGASVFTFTMKKTIQNEVSDTMMNQLTIYNSTGESILDSVQKNYNCCGVNNYMDWENINWKDDDDHDAIVPMSCCKTSGFGCNQNEDGINTEGCLLKLVHQMEIVIYAVFGFCVAVGVLQVITALVACYGAVLIRRYQSYDVL